MGRKSLIKSHTKIKSKSHKTTKTSSLPFNFLSFIKKGNFFFLKPNVLEDIIRNNIKINKQAKKKKLTINTKYLPPSDFVTKYHKKYKALKHSDDKKSFLKSVFRTYVKLSCLSDFVTVIKSLRINLVRLEKIKSFEGLSPKKKEIVKHLFFRIINAWRLFLLKIKFLCFLFPQHKVKYISLRKNLYHSFLQCEPIMHLILDYLEKDKTVIDLKKKALLEEEKRLKASRAKFDSIRKKYALKKNSVKSSLILLKKNNKLPLRWSIEDIKDSFTNHKINFNIYKTFSATPRNAYVKIGQGRFWKAIKRYRNSKELEYKEKLLNEFIQQYQKEYIQAVKNKIRSMRLNNYVRSKKESAKDAIIKPETYKPSSFFRRPSKPPINFKALDYVYNYRILSISEIRSIFNEGMESISWEKKQDRFLKIEHKFLIRSSARYRSLPFPDNEKFLSQAYQTYIKEAPIDRKKNKITEVKKRKLFISKRVFASNVLDNSFYIDGKVLDHYYKKARVLKVSFVNPIPYYKRLRKIMSKWWHNKKGFEEFRKSQISKLYKDYVQSPTFLPVIDLTVTRPQIVPLSLDRFRVFKKSKLKIKKSKAYKKKKIYIQSSLFQIKKKFKMYRKFKYLISPVHLETIWDKKLRSLKLQRLKLKVIHQFYFKYLGNQNLKIIQSLLTKTIKYMKKIYNNPVFLLETKIDLLLSRLFKVRVIIAQKWIRRKEILLNNSPINDNNYLLKPMQIIRMAVTNKNWRILRLKKRFRYLHKKVNFFLFFPKIYSFLWWSGKFDWDFFKEFKIRQPYIRRKDAWRLKFTKEEYTLIQKKTLPYLLWDKPIKQKLGY